MKRKTMIRPSLAVLFAGAFAMAFAMPVAMADDEPCSLPPDNILLVEFLWPALDEDGDGEISFEEAEALSDAITPALFDIADLDDNGAISMGEMLFILNSGIVPIDLLDLLDGNGDGVISEDEAEDYLDDDVFEDLDANENGYLDCEDFFGGVEGEHEDEGEFEYEGEDDEEGEYEFEGEFEDEGEFEFEGEDFEIELCELLHLLLALFGVIDTNGDGVITSAELDAAWELIEGLFPDVDDISDIIELYSDNAAALISIDDILAFIEAECSGVEEGEFEFEGEIDPFCPLPNSFHVLVDFAFPIVDADNNGAWSVEETAALAGPFTPEIFAFFDFNNDSQLTLDELLVPTFAPIEVLPLVDANGNGVIEFEEVAGIMDPALFDEFDRNGNGVLDCEDLDISGEGETEGDDEEGEDEGEEEGEEEGDDEPPLCILARSLAHVFRIADANDDWQVTREEYYNLPLGAPLFDIEPLFVVADSDFNGAISVRELLRFLADECLEPRPCDLVQGILDNFADFDWNNDGEITQDEIILPAIFPQPNLDRLFAFADRDGSGGLSQAEMRQFLAQVCDEGPALCDLADFFATLFRDLDHNDDGEVTPEEIDNILIDIALPDFGPLFAAADKNGNGAISVRELLGFLETFCNEPRPCGFVESLLADFDNIDGNGSGEIEEDEILLPPGIPNINLFRVFNLADSDRSGGLSKDELRRFLDRVCDDDDPFDPYLCSFAGVLIEWFPVLDTEPDGALTREEINGLPIDIPFPNLEPLFALADQNNDGALSLTELMRFLHQYCGDDPDRRFCEFVPIVLDLFPLLDANNDGAITIDEVTIVVAATGFVFDDVFAFFQFLDIDGDQRVTMDEVLRRLAQCDGTGEGEGEGEEEGETEGEPGDDAVTLRRSAGNGTYEPGGTVIVTVVIDALRPDTISAIGLAESIPTGWVLKDILNTGGADATPAAGDTGTLDFAWIDVPSFPVEVVYELEVPADASGTVAIMGQALYRTTTSGEMATDVVVTPLGERGAGDVHSADTDGDWSIALGEVLRVIQLFNLGGFGCDASSEDGYAPGSDDHSCAPHDSDYNTQNWEVNLSELLRLVQLYNSPASAYYGDRAGEDGYAPGVFDL